MYAPSEEQESGYHPQLVFLAEVFSFKHCMGLFTTVKGRAGREKGKQGRGWAWTLVYHVGMED